MYEDSFKDSILELTKKSKKPVVAFININHERVAEHSISDKHLAQIRALLAHRTFEELELVIHSNGGDAHAAGQIAHLLRSSSNSLKGYVPFTVYSGGTMITMACDEIVMGSYSTIGPLDTQMYLASTKDRSSSLEIFKGLDEMRRFSIETFDMIFPKIREISKDNLELIDEIKLASEIAIDISSKLIQKPTPREVGLKKRSLEMCEDYLRRILKANNHFSYDESTNSGSNLGEEVRKRLIYSFNDHRYPISREEAIEMGLPVIEATEEEERLFDTISYDILHGEGDIIFFYDPKSKRVTTPDEFCL